MRVMLVDDHVLVRDGIASLLRAHGYQVVGEAEDGLQAVDKARKLQPDLILMDVRMPEMNGLEATRLIKTEMPAIKVVMLTVSEGEEDLFEAIKSGADGYLIKKVRASNLFESLDAIAEGEPPLSPRLAGKILEELKKRMRQESGTRTGTGGLSPREIDVLQLVAQGGSNREVAETLHISEPTVKFHIRNILDKLHLQNRAQVIAWAARHATRLEGHHQG